MIRQLNTLAAALHRGAEWTDRLAHDMGRLSEAADCADAHAQHAAWHYRSGYPRWFEWKVRLSAMRAEWVTIRAERADVSR